ncbi:MAG: hypothetical protein ABSF58_08990 [Solirubrobacteraceae bacterium]|jgi:hypothetical protein
MEARIETTARLAGAPRHLSLVPPIAESGPGAFGDTLRRAKRTARRMRARRAPAPSATVALSVPPPEVERELAQAALACQALADQGKELRFDRSADGRVSVELIDVAGCAPAVIGPSGLFALLAQSG